jgi:Flp pilus assembly protein TadG
MFPSKQLSTGTSRRPRFLRRRRVTGNNSSDRSGAAAVEAAFCFPLIILLMLGTLEVTAGLFLKESVSVCCFEACRIGTRRGATAANVQARAVQVLADRGVDLGSSGQIQIIPSNFDSLSSLDPITVRITAPTAGNSIFIFDNLINRNVTSEVTMIREFDD